MKLKHLPLLIIGSLILGHLAEALAHLISPDDKALEWTLVIVVCGAWGFYFTRIYDWLFPERTQ